jgi:hypothetical protein
MCDEAGDTGKQAVQRVVRRRPLEPRVPRQSPHAENIAVALEPAELGNAVDVDDELRPGAAIVELEHEALPAGKYTGGVSVLGQKLECLTDLRWSPVLEGRRFHRARREAAIGSGLDPYFVP